MPFAVFRADGGPSIGSGHVMRCLALATVLREGGWSIGFAATGETFSSVAALREAPFDHLNLESADPVADADTLRRHWSEGADLLIVDHYARDAAFERACGGWAQRIVAFDDLANRPHDADVLVDPATPAAAYRDLVPERCKVLSNTSHAIVHPAFREARASALARRGGDPVQRVLISFGQVDPTNATMHAIAALRQVKFAGNVDVVLGRAAPHLSTVRAAIDARFRLHVDAADMVELISNADLGIGAGGMTTWERCCLGLPSVVVTIAENQRATISRLLNAGAGADAGPAEARLTERLADAVAGLIDDHRRRAEMSEASAALVDGRGADRVAAAAIGPTRSKNGRQIELRLAGMQDESWLLALQSQCATRAFANNTSVPAPIEHRRWLAKTLADPRRLLMIAEVDGERAAMLRVDRDLDADRISIAVDTRLHRQGVGAAVLKLVGRLRPGRPMEAEILPGNTASRALFAVAGYLQVDATMFRREPR